MIHAVGTEWSDPIAVSGPAKVFVQSGEVLFYWDGPGGPGPSARDDGMTLRHGDSVELGFVTGQRIWLRQSGNHPARVFIGPWWSQ